MRLKKVLYLVPYGSNIGEKLKARGELALTEVLHCRTEEWPTVLSEEIRGTTKDIVVVAIMDPLFFDRLVSEPNRIKKGLAEFCNKFDIIPVKESAASVKALSKFASCSVLPISQLAA